MFRPGDGPFRAKGTVYQSLIASTDARCPGGYAAVVARLESEELRAFFQQNFLAASWYDLLPLPTFSRTAALVANASPAKYARDGARFTATRDINGVYRFFLKLASPKMVVERLPRAMMQYFDFGHAEVVTKGPKAYDVIGSGIPEPIVEWFMTMIAGFVPVALELSGAKSIVARLDPVEPDGRAHGVLLVRSRLHLAWV